MLIKRLLSKSHNFVKLAFCFLAVSCASSKTIESPTIYLSNLSEKPIFDIKCQFPSGDTLSLPYLAPGISRSQAFNIASNADFFGKILVSWKNGEKRILEREFYLMKKNLPSIDNTSSFNYLQFFLEQEDFEVISSDAPDLAAKAKRMEDVLNQIAENHKNNIDQPVSYSLIRITPKRIDQIPPWMLNKYD